MYLIVPAPFDPLRITLYRALECDVIIKSGPLGAAMLEWYSGLYIVGIHTRIQHIGDEDLHLESHDGTAKCWVIVRL